MEITIECEDKEDKEWYERNMESIVDQAIFDLGATVVVDGWYCVYKGYNHAYHSPKCSTPTTGDVNDLTKQSKLTGD